MFISNESLCKISHNILCFLHFESLFFSLCFPSSPQIKASWYKYLKNTKIIYFFLEKGKDSKPPIIYFLQKAQKNKTNNNLGNETSLLEDHMNDTNVVNQTKILPDAKKSNKKTQKSVNSTFSNITDISFAKNYAFIALGLCFLVSLIFVFFKRKLLFSLYFVKTYQNFHKT